MQFCINGGLCEPLPDPSHHPSSQSVARKAAYAKAYAEHLSRAGIDATYGSRLD